MRQVFIKIWRLKFAIAICLLCVMTPILAQQQSALHGRVTDSLGGAVAGVSVLTIDASGAGRTTTTDEQGKYIFPALPPGRYTLRINAPGFSLYENASVEISGAHSESFNVVLSVAGAAEEVTIDLQIRFNF